METPSLSKMAQLGFWSKKMRNVLKRMKNNWAMSQLPIYRPLTSSEIAIFTCEMRNVRKRMNNQLSDFYFLIYGRFYLQFTGDTP